MQKNDSDYLKFSDLNFAAGRLAICKKHNFYATIIPKNLSSSLIYFILNADYPDVAKNINQNSPGEIHKFLGLILVDNFFHIDSSYKKLIFLREPTQRIFSAFYSKFIFDVEWSSVIVNPVSSFLKKPIPDITFSDFIFYLRCHPHYWLDPHFSSQSRFILFDKYDEYFHVENTSSFAEKLDFLSDLTTINQGSARYLPKNLVDYSSVKCSNLPLSELWKSVGKSENLPSSCDMLTPEILDILHQKYKDDYFLYGLA